MPRSKSKATSPRLRSYNMMYVQQMDKLPAQTLDKLEELIKDRLKPKEWAYIVHNKDTDGQGQPIIPHVHVMLCFDNARSLSNVAKLLGDRPQYIEKWDDRPNNGFSYLTHRCKTSQKDGDYQYDFAEVNASFDYSALMQQISTEIAEAKTEHEGGVKPLLNALYCGTMSKAEVEERLSGSQMARYAHQIDTVWAKRLERQAQIWRDEMQQQGKKVETIWVYGEAGTGKTRWATQYAEKLGQEYFVAGSTRDIFQAYGGQHTLILDELRPASIPYADLLRITDPYSIRSEVMAPSRYNDRAIACDTIIITTPYDPGQFYTETFRVKNTLQYCSTIDSFDQLLRRLSTIIRMTKTTIDLMSCEPTKGFTPVHSRPNMYYQPTASTAPSKSIFDRFNAMFD